LESDEPCSGEVGSEPNPNLEARAESRVLAGEDAGLAEWPGARVKMTNASRILVSVDDERSIDLHWSDPCGSSPIHAE
jgi:hypothetical protein